MSGTHRPPAWAAAAPEVVVVAAVLAGAAALGVLAGDLSAVLPAVTGLLVLVVVTARLSGPPRPPQDDRPTARHPSGDVTVTVPASSRWVR